MSEASEDPRPLVVVSNRGPTSFRTGPDGRLVRAGTGGGLASSLKPLLVGTGATWVSCAMSEADRKAAAQGLMEEEGLHVVVVEPDPETYRLAYDVVSNATLWFLHHLMFDPTRRPRIDQRWRQAWDGYRAFNAAFAEAVDAAAPPRAAVLVQDYHLTLLPAMLAARRPDVALVHFSHTPFADPSGLRMLPDDVRRELLEGMAAATCGFHSARWRDAFLACCDDAGVVAPSTYVSPLASDPDDVGGRAAAAAAGPAGERVRALAGGRRVVLRVDRMEPSKNLLRGFWAFDELLDRHPELRGEVVFLALAYASRQTLPQYLAYAAEAEQTAAVVNSRWATDGWTPVILDVEDDAERSMAALTSYDVLLVNPVRDGLNLVAKEGPLVNRNDGVLVLSREAGAYEELAGDCLAVNPFDVSATADALAEALTMAPERRAAMASALRATVAGRHPADWLAEQVAAAG